MNLQQLGQPTIYSFTYDPKLLERFAFTHVGQPMMVTLNCPEFTSLCPITSQPDYATIYINYIPDLWCVESKSLKLYMFSFRNHGGFHEDCIGKICNDLYTLMEPLYIEVLGHFLPRGGISIDPFMNKGKTEEYQVFAKQRLVQRNIPVTTVSNR